jgi:transcriptional regulator with AAA-type ATPase domain
MAQRNFIAGSEVPSLTNRVEEDLPAMQEYLYKMVEQLRFELQQRDESIRALQEQIAVLRG